MIKELVTDINKLTERASEWDVKSEMNDKVITIIQDLDDTLKYLNKIDGRLFLTSNQIGYTERAFVIKFEDENKFFFNPIFYGRKDVVLSREKDYLSGVEYFVPRYKQCIINYQDSLGRPKANRFDNEASVVVCQAMDALEGLLVSDWGLEIIPEFDLASKEEQQEVISEYIKSLTAFRDTLDKDLTESEDKEEYKAIKFMQGVADGSIKVEHEEPKLNRAQRRGLAKVIKRISNKIHKKK